MVRHFIRWKGGNNFHGSQQQELVKIAVHIQLNSFIYFELVATALYAAKHKFRCAIAFWWGGLAVQH
jgi:hypothetical protein